MLDALTIDSPSSTEPVLDKLDKYGVTVLRNFTPKEELPALKREFLDLLSAEEGSPTSLRKGESRVARVNGAIDAKRFPATARFFHSPFMESVAREYFAPYSFTLNEQVYLTHDKNVMDFSTEWHTDPSRSLKFFLYLTDTTRANGAFMYAPRSHREGFYRLIYYSSRGLKDLPTRIPEDEVPLTRVSVEAPEGSLIVFEAAGMHRAGVMEPGQERLVIRGHCFPKTSRLGRFVRRVLLRSPLNLVHYNLCHDDYVSDRFKTRADVYR